MYHKTLGGGVFKFVVRTTKKCHFFFDVAPNPRHSKLRSLFTGPVFVRNFPKAASKFNDGIVFEGKFYVRKLLRT